MGNIDAEKFRQAILDINAEFKAASELGFKNRSEFDDLSAEYEKQCKDLLLVAVQSNNWDEILDEITFFMRVGNTSGILLEKIFNIHNTLTAPAINSAAHKITSLEEILYCLNSELETRKTNARKGVEIKLANDPKQKAKDKVKQLWQLWQEKPYLYKSTAAFAKDMLIKFEMILENQKVIEGWCRDWKGKKK